MSFECGPCSSESRESECSLMSSQDCKEQGHLMCSLCFCTSWFFVIVAATEQRGYSLHLRSALSSFFFLYLESIQCLTTCLLTKEARYTKKRVYYMANLFCRSVRKCPTLIGYPTNRPQWMKTFFFHLGLWPRPTRLRICHIIMDHSIFRIR